MNYSITEPSARQKWFASLMVVAYAVITLLPLVWIVSTGFKSSSDSIAYPPKAIFQPTVEGYINLFTTQTRLSNEAIKESRENLPWYEKIVREILTQVKLDDYRFKTLVKEIVSSYPFQYKLVPSSDKEAN